MTMFGNVMKSDIGCNICVNVRTLRSGARPRPPRNHRIVKMFSIFSASVAYLPLFPTVYVYTGGTL